MADRPITLTGVKTEAADGEARRGTRALRQTKGDASDAAAKQREMP
jgi:hypothetical protein